MAKTLYLIRHCEAEGNVNRIFHGHYDSNITEKGKKQLLLLERRFADIHLDAVYSSPLLRARKTAQAVLHGKGLELIICPGLEEINGGNLENLPWSEFPVSYPEQAACWIDAPHTVIMPGGESMYELYDRIWQTVTSIVSSMKDGDAVAAVSHGCAIRAFLARVTGYGIERLNDIGWCDNTAVSKIVFDGDTYNIEYMYDSSHLDANMSTLENQSWYKSKDKDDYFS